MSAVACKYATLVSTSDQSSLQSRLVRNDPARLTIIAPCGCSSQPCTAWALAQSLTTILVIFVNYPRVVVVVGQFFESFREVSVLRR